MAHKERTLIVARVSYGNIALCLILSRFFRLECLSFRNSSLRRLSAGRISLFDWESHGDPEEITEFCHTVISPTWARDVKPQAALRIRVNGQDVDVTEKMFKELGPAFQSMQQLERFGGEHEEFLPGIDAYLIARHTTAPVRVGSSLVLRFCARLNMMAEHLERQVARFIQIMRDGARLVRTFGTPRCSMKASIVVEIVNSNELSLDSDKLTFAWLHGDSDLSPQEILYLLPGGIPTGLREGLHTSGIQAVESIFDLGGLLNWADRIATLRVVFASLARTTLGMAAPSILNEAHRWSPRLICWHRLKPIVGIETYVDSLSSALTGSYDTLFLKSLGVNTVMHTYSMNSSAASSRIPVPEFHLSYSRFLHEYMTVWTRQYGQSVRNRYSRDLRFYISGPAMAGRSNYQQSELTELRSRYCPKWRTERLAISVFDVSPQVPGWAAGNHSFVQSMYNEDFCCTFLEDICRLVLEENFSIIYKPKRNWQSELNPVPGRMEKVFQKMAGDRRWITLSAETNPWIPVLLSDLVVAIPFTSIALAAESRDVPFVFHNANGEIKFHSYGDYESRITHSYEELKRIVEQTPERDRAPVQDTERPSISQGFVDFLRDPKRLSIGAELDRELSRDAYAASKT